MKKIVFFVLLALQFVNSNSQTLKYSNAFLGIGIGGRAMAMGGAVISSGNDVTSTYWNPAGLMGIEDNFQIGLMHNEQFAGIAKHDYGAIGFKLNEKSRAAISMIRFGIDGIPNTLYLMQDGQINYNLIKEFSAVDYGFVGSYATKTGVENLNIGANMKVIRRVIGDFGGAWGFGFDLGATYKYKNYQLGVAAYDITGTFNAWTYNLSESDKQQLISTGNTLPKGGLEITLPRLVLGASRSFELMSNKISIRPELNFEFTTDGQRNVLISSKVFNMDPRLGLEMGYKNLVFLRGGLQKFQRVKDFDGKETLNAMPSLGVGLKLSRISIDYALGNAFNEGLLAMSNIISLKLSIVKK
jgi:hypothetical protein